MREGGSIFIPDPSHPSLTERLNPRESGGEQLPTEDNFITLKRDVCIVVQILESQVLTLWDV